uniref:Uncharacterized protein n=1 Tax=Rhizophora mucronata TaxID=61149 RepID=A0A2P2Q8G6_RHIMU
MGRSPCCDKARVNKGAWTREEDELLIAYIKAHGEGCWKTLPKAAGLLRCGKSCRLRWINYLRPDLRRGNFTEEEDELIVKLHSLLGNRWSLIAGKLPGRTDNEIKNYWNAHIRKKLLSRGINPSTHRSVNEEKEEKANCGLSRCENQKNPDRGNHGELNLELRICPPYQHSPEKLESKGRNVVCFYCSLGLQNSKECSCRGSTSGNGHDFRGLKISFLDYLRLEMK